MEIVDRDLESKSRLAEVAGGAEMVGRGRALSLFDNKGNVSALAHLSTENVFGEFALGDVGVVTVSDNDFFRLRHLNLNILGLEGGEDEVWVRSRDPALPKPLTRGDNGTSIGDPE